MGILDLWDKSEKKMEKEKQISDAEKRNDPHDKLTEKLLELRRDEGFKKLQKKISELTRKILTEETELKACEDDQTKAEKQAQIDGLKNELETAMEEHRNSFK